MHPLTSRSIRPPAIDGRRATWTAAVALLLMLLAAALPNAHARLRPPDAPAEWRDGPIVFTQVPVHPASAHDAPGATRAPDTPDGARIVSYDPSRPDVAPRTLTTGFLAAGKPQVSFDGQRLLFIGRRTEDDPLNVWEMHADGTRVRQITRDVGTCVSAIYLSTLYTMVSENPEHQIAFCAIPSRGGASSLYACRMDGSGVHRITFNPYGVSDPSLLSDGRLLYASAQPPDVSTGEPGGRALFTVNTDGTDVFPFAAAHLPPAFRGMATETDDGRVIYVEAPLDRTDRGGSLFSISRAASLSGRRSVASDEAGSFRAPCALGAGRVLVSYLADTADSWGLSLIDRGGDVPTMTVYDAPQWHEIDAAPLRPRPEPAGRSSVVDGRVQTGVLYCLNASLSNLDPARNGAERRIASVQIFRATGEAAHEAPRVVAEELIGLAPVESDGSFHLRVPARAPLRLQTLDAEGRPIQAMRNWIWVMPKEARGCIGCHEDRELSPPNRHVLALRKAPIPVGETVPADGEHGLAAQAPEVPPP